MVLNTIENTEYNSVWSENDCDNHYKKATDSMSQGEAFMLYKIKNDLHLNSKTGWKDFCKRNEVNLRTADSKIAHLVAQCEFSLLSTSENNELPANIVLTWDIVTDVYKKDNEVRDISFSNYEKLKGSSVEEKMTSYDEIKKKYKTNKPTRKQITDYNSENTLDKNVIKIKKFKKWITDISTNLIFDNSELLDIIKSLKQTGMAPKSLERYEGCIKAMKGIQVLEVRIEEAKN